MSPKIPKIAACLDVLDAGLLVITKRSLQIIKEKSKDCHGFLSFFKSKLFQNNFFLSSCVLLLTPSIPAFSPRPVRCKMDENGAAEMQRCSRCSCGDATNLEGFLDGEPRHVTGEVSMYQL